MMPLAPSMTIIKLLNISGNEVRPNGPLVGQNLPNSVANVHFN